MDGWPAVVFVCFGCPKIFHSQRRIRIGAAHNSEPSPAEHKPVVSSIRRLLLDRRQRSMIHAYSAIKIWEKNYALDQAVKSVICGIFPNRQTTKYILLHQSWYESRGEMELVLEFDRWLECKCFEKSETLTNLGVLRRWLDRLNSSSKRLATVMHSSTWERKSCY